MSALPSDAPSSQPWADWVERHLQRTLTPFQRVAVELICTAKRRGPYDFPRTFELADWGREHSISFIIRGGLTSVDSDGLTRLVVGAHDAMVRVDIAGAGPDTLRVSMWPRKTREGALGARCPTIETAAAGIRRTRRW